MSRCVSDSCRQGRELCPTPSACSGAGEDEPISTPEEAMSLVDVALSLVVAIALAAIVVATVAINWPLFLAAVK